MTPWFDIGVTVVSCVVILMVHAGADQRIARVRKALADVDRQCVGLRESYDQAQAQASRTTAGMLARDMAIDTLTRRLDQEQEAHLVMLNRFEAAQAMVHSLQAQQDPGVDVIERDGWRFTAKRVPFSTEVG